MSDPAGHATGDVPPALGKAKGKIPLQRWCVLLCFPASLKQGLGPCPAALALGTIWEPSVCHAQQASAAAAQGCVCTRTRNVCFSLLTFSE